MRLLIAGLVFIIAVFAITSLITAAFPADAPEWLTIIAILVAVVCSLYLTNKLVNVRGTDFWGRPHAAETPEQLEADGMLDTAAYRARRAFQAEESDAEGSHYFLELHDGAVLYLTGRYLHDHEPIEFEGETVQHREFPCTEFTIRRRIDDGAVVDMQCSGRVFEPEAVTRPWNADDFPGKTELKDGSLITGCIYEELLARLAGSRAV